MDKARVMPPGKTGHRNTWHGRRAGYNAEVGDLMQKEWDTFKRKNGFKGPGNHKQRVAFRDKFLKLLKRQGCDTMIGTFNNSVEKGGDPEVKKAKARSKFSKPKGFGRGGIKLLSVGSSVAGAANFASNMRDGVGALRGEETVHGTYYWKDDSGTYNYERDSVFWARYRYVNGCREGETGSTLYFWAKLKIQFKSIFNRPTQKPKVDFFSGPEII
jgi:hypothetical protein